MDERKLFDEWLADWRSEVEHYAAVGYHVTQERALELFAVLDATRVELATLRAVPESAPGEPVCVDEDCPYPEHVGECGPKTAEQWEHIARLRARNLATARSRSYAARADDIAETERVRRFLDAMIADVDDRWAHEMVLQAVRFVRFAESPELWERAVRAYRAHRDAARESERKAALADIDAERMFVGDEGLRELDNAAARIDARALAPALGQIDREALGRLVREVWIAWAREQPSPKPSWLVSWEGLDEPDREVDRRIGEAVAARALGSARVPEADTTPRRLPSAWDLIYGPGGAEEKRREREANATGGREATDAAKAARARGEDMYADGEGRAEPVAEPSDRKEGPK